MAEKMAATVHGLGGGWATPLNEVQRHYFEGDGLRSLCGRSFWTGPRTPRAAGRPGDCPECDSVYEQQLAPELEEV